jgi:hypothetical protein
MLCGRHREDRDREEDDEGLRCRSEVGEGTGLRRRESNHPVRERDGSCVGCAGLLFASRGKEVVMLSNADGDLRRGGMESMIVGASDHGGWVGGGGEKP